MKSIIPKRDESRALRPKSGTPTPAVLVLVAFAGALMGVSLRPSPAADSPQASPFQPSWESLGQYRCPDWFRDAKFGISAHWDAQSLPEQGDNYAKLIYEDDEPNHEFHVEHYGHPSKVGFKEIDRLWRAEHWQPRDLIQLYRRAGARYFVALANDHDNFDCFASTYQPWNSVNIGPRKDIVGDWAREARKAGLRFGVRVGAADAWSWFGLAQGADDEGPLEGVSYDGKLTRSDGRGTWWQGYEPQDLYAQNHKRGARPDEAYVKRFYLRTKELIDRYQPDLLAFDSRGMPLQHTSDVGLQLAAYFYNKDRQRHGGRLDVVLNTKGDATPRHCLVWDVERGVSDRIEPYPWQADTSIGRWHYLRSLFEQHQYKSPQAVIHMLIDAVSKNGNLLLNVPLRGDGTLDADETALLEKLASWMKTNGEAIFGTRPWKTYGEGPSTEAPRPPFVSFNERITRPFTARDIRFTTKGDTLYAFTLGWPEGGTLTLKSLATSSASSRKVKEIRLLGYNGRLKWQQNEGGLTITLPPAKPGEYAFAFRIPGMAT
jgi:alpha-L-fucosidase